MEVQNAIRLLRQAGFSPEPIADSPADIGGRMSLMVPVNIKSERRRYVIPIEQIGPEWDWADQVPGAFVTEIINRTKPWKVEQSSELASAGKK